MDIEETMEFILQQQANMAVQQATAAERHDREMGEIRQGLDRVNRRLDRAVRLAVREARAERVRRQELDARLTASHAALQEEVVKLAAAQRAFIDSMKRGGNGDH